MQSKKADMIIHFATASTDVDVKFTIKDKDNHQKTVKSKTINLKDFKKNWEKTQDDDCCTLVISFKNGKIPTSHKLTVSAKAANGVGFISDNAELIKDPRVAKTRYVVNFGFLEDFGLPEVHPE